MQRRMTRPARPPAATTCASPDDTRTRCSDPSNSGNVQTLPLAPCSSSSACTPSPIPPAEPPSFFLLRFFLRDGPSWSMSASASGASAWGAEEGSAAEISAWIAG
eukprot:2678064-Rhodomonas_salina.2